VAPARDDPRYRSPTPAGILLLRAVGDLLREGGALTVETAAVAAALGREQGEVDALIGRGRVAALIEGQGGAVWLTRQGEMFYRWDRHRR
jgi:hypothetical protein